MIDFLLSNWSWLGALIGAPFSFVSFVAGRRGLGWLMVGLVVLLLIWTAVSAARDFVQDERDAERAACNADWKEDLAEAERTANDLRRDLAKAQNDLNAERSAKRQQADADDAARTDETIREIIHVSPSAKSCVLDAATVDALNRLR